MALPWRPLLVIVTATLCYKRTQSFTPALTQRRSSLLASSVGDGKPPSNNDGKQPWDDFLDPNREESEALRKAREFMSENSLPISFESDKISSEGAPFSTNSSAITLLQGSPAEEILRQNPYMAVVSKLTPSEMISKFTATAHPRVQDAVRTTILGLIGGLPKMAFDTSIITTGQKLASLMFQLQMTGYMFKNAEYRLSLRQSLGVEGVDATAFLLGGTNGDEETATDTALGKVHGKIKVRYQVANESTDASQALAGPGLEMEVDAAAFTSELRKEVEELRDELILTRQQKDEALRKDLLTYIRTLPEKELRSLSSTMSQEVLEAMKGLVNAVLAGIGEGEIKADTVTEQSGEAMAQLCMWQLVIGYNMRTLEVREEMKRSLGATFGASYTDDDNTLPYSSSGAFE